MITYKRNIDGLPGVTLPGVKGDTGNRGAMTFYSADSSTNYDLNYMYTLGFISDSSTYDITYDLLGTSVNSDVLSICSNGVKPELYDNILINETAGTAQYQIADIINISYDDASAYITSDASTSLNANKFAVLNYMSTLPAINSGETIQIESLTNISLDDITSNTSFIDSLLALLKDSDETFDVCVLTKLDIWEYNASTSDDFDYTVSFSLKDIEYDGWDGYYKRVDDASIEYMFNTLFDNIGSQDIDADDNVISNNKLAEIKKKVDTAETIYRKTHNIESFVDFCEMAKFILGELFDIELSNIDDTVNVYVKAISTDNIYNSSIPVSNINLYAKQFSFNSSIVKERFDNLSTRVSDAIIVTALNSIGRTDETGMLNTKLTKTGKYPIYSIKNNTDTGVLQIFFNGYIIANAISGISPEVCSTAWTPYSKYYKITENEKYIEIFTFLRSDLNNDNKSLTVPVKIPAYLTNEPVGSTKSNIQAVQINVKSSVNTANAANYKIEIEFIPNNNGVFIMDVQSVIPTLWTGETDYDRLCLNTAAGNIKNYSRTLNFDTELPEQFIYTVKEYNDANNGANSFAKTLYIPADMIYNYTAHLYIYSKTSAASANKIYLGTVEF